MTAMKTSTKDRIATRFSNQPRTISITLAIVVMLCAWVAASAQQSALTTPPVSAGAFASGAGTIAAPSMSAAPVTSNDAAAQAAFNRAWTVFNSPRCRNCHPAGDAPLQGDDSHVHLHKVTTGARQGDNVVVLAGVAEGDRVVTTGAGFLNEGDLVKLAAPAAGGEH